MEDAFIVLAPPILTLIGILWFFSDERVPTRVAQVLMSFVDSFLALLTSDLPNLILSPNLLTPLQALPH